ncbi:hypothetical protein PC39_12807 [Salinisphaera sp. PC39]
MFFEPECSLYVNFRVVQFDGFAVVRDAGEQHSQCVLRAIKPSLERCIVDGFQKARLQVLVTDQRAYYLDVTGGLRWMP